MYLVAAKAGYKHKLCRRRRSSTPDLQLPDVQLRGELLELEVHDQHEELPRVEQPIRLRKGRRVALHLSPNPTFATAIKAAPHSSEMLILLLKKRDSLLKFT